MSLKREIRQSIIGRLSFFCALFAAGAYGDAQSGRFHIADSAVLVCKGAGLMCLCGSVVPLTRRLRHKVGCGRYHD